MAQAKIAERAHATEGEALAARRTGCYRPPMTTAPRLDHIGIVAHDLAAAAAQYEQLGFRLTPLARQSGPLAPGGAVVPWGSANRCAMLGAGYIELLGIVERGLYDNDLGRFLARYQGIHILALGIDDAEAELARLRAAGFAIAGIRPMQRPAGGGIARFQRLPIPEAQEGRIQLIRHETPELLWRPELTAHPNRAAGLIEAVLCVADLEAAAERFRRLAGVAPERGGGAATFPLAGARLVLCEAPALPAFVPGATPPTLPWFAGFTLATDDGNEAVRRLLAERGIDHAEAEGRLAVPPDCAAGAACVFAAERQASSPAGTGDASIGI